MADTTGQNTAGRGSPTYSNTGSRTSSQTSSKAPKGGTGGKRYVRTAAGAQRYKKPIGTEIVAQPRDSRGARAQSDKESVDRYKALVSGDSEAQRQAMAKLSDDQLKRLSEVAFSFRSSDPAVARLRAGVTLELQRRSLDVGRYGGLSGRTREKGAGGGSSGDGVEVINFATGERYRVASKGQQKASREADRAAERDERLALHEQLMAERKRRAEAERARKKAEADAKAAQRKAEAEARRRQTQADALERIRTRNTTRYSTRPPSRVMQLSNVSTQARKQAAKQGNALPGGRFPIRNVADLRNAIIAFGRAKPQDRERVAKLICRRAKELNAEHMLGEGILKAAGYGSSGERVKADLRAKNLSNSGDFRVIELEGKWKHGWIPLDAAAVRAKTKGRGGKPWWDAGAKGHHGGSSGGGGKSNPAFERFLEKEGPGFARKADQAETDVKSGKRSSADVFPALLGPGSKHSGDRTTVVKSGMTPSQRDARIAELERKDRATVKGLTPSQTQELNALRRERSGADRPPRNFGLPDEPKRNTTAMSDQQKRDTLRVLNQRLERVGGDESRLSPKEREMLQQLRGGNDTSKSPEQKPNPSISAAPKSPLATATLGRRMSGGPEGLDAYPLKDNAGGDPLYDIAVYKDGQLVGFVKKRSGYSQTGKSGAAIRTKNTGYSFYDAKGHRIGNASSRVSALSSLRPKR